MKTVKFGGSSVAGSEQFKKVRQIVEADPERKIVIVSAAGKRNGDDHKITDLLYLCHAHITYGVSCDDILDEICSRFAGIRDELGLKYDVEADFEALRRRMNKSMSVDELVSRGEYFTSRLMAEYLGFSFVDASECVLFGADGQLDKESTYTAISKAFSDNGKILIPGFYGSLPNGKIKVMSRGGSDITGALAAAAAGAEVYENWTDVSGILMADPKIVKNPKAIPAITYAELRELAYMGASVLHEESVMPVKEAGIKLNIRNTNRPEDPGTMIVEGVDSEESERPITGVSGRKDFKIITVLKREMNTSECLRKALEIFDRYHVNADQITLGLDSFALVCSSGAIEDSFYDIIADIRRQCRPDDVLVEENIALVAAVGRKMTSKPGTSGMLFKALGDKGINIRTIAQGADEISIIVGVENDKFEDAIRVLYEGFAG